MMPLGRFVALSLLWLASCGHEEAAEALLDVGDPCRGPQRFCVDEQSVRACVEDEWAIVDCEVVCNERGPAWVADGCAEDCVCILADPSGCSPAETTCADDETVEQCSDTQSWESFDCATLCIAMQLESLGCWPADAKQPASCWCTTEGTPCVADSQPTCVDGETLGSCEGGVWAYEDCVQVCGGPAACVPWTTPASCACEG